MHVENSVKNQLQKCGVGKGKLLVVAVSGGPDSLALLFTLFNLKDKLGFKIHGAHLDHKLRGDDSKADANFVRQTFQNLDIESTIDHADVAAIQQKHHLSLEEAARIARYEFLTSLAIKIKADAICTGHTADDHAETILMNIIRGSGITGLRGILPSRLLNNSHKEIILIRPLLELSRKDTLDYCKSKTLQPRFDNTNLSMSATRNRIRLELFPILEKYNPSIKKSLARLSFSAVKQLDYLDSQIKPLWEKSVQIRENCLILDKNIFTHLESALQTHLIRHAISYINGSLKSFDQNHFQSMIRLILGPAGSTLHLPHNIRLEVFYNEAVITASKVEMCPFPKLEGNHIIRVPGETNISGWNISTYLHKKENDKIQQFDSENLINISNLDSQPSTMHRFKILQPENVKQLDVFTNFQSIDKNITLRTRKPGDRFQPLGMTHSKKLQDFMVDAKIPSQWRDRIPLITSAKGIAWIAGFRIAEWAKVTENTDEILEIRLQANS